MQQQTAATTIQQALREKHGQFEDGTYVIGVNLQLVKPEQDRPCPVCKKNRLVLWEEAGSPDPKPRWWKCERRSYTDICMYASPAYDFPEVSGMRELDGTYDISKALVFSTTGITTCQLCRRGTILLYHPESGTWGRCVCGFAYHAGLYSPRGHMMRALVEKRNNFREALNWYDQKLRPRV